MPLGRMKKKSRDFHFPKDALSVVGTARPAARRPPLSPTLTTPTAKSHSSLLSPTDATPTPLSRKCSLCYACASASKVVTTCFGVARSAFPGTCCIVYIYIYTAVILEPKGGDAKRASPGLEKASWLYREKEMTTRSSSAIVQQHKKKEVEEKNITEHQLCHSSALGRTWRS